MFHPTRIVTNIDKTIAREPKESALCVPLHREKKTAIMDSPRDIHETIVDFNLSYMIFGYLLLDNYSYYSEVKCSIVRDRDLIVSCWLVRSCRSSAGAWIDMSPLLAFDCGADAIAMFFALFLRSISPFSSSSQSAESSGYIFRISAIVVPDNALCSPFPLKVEG